MYSIKFTAQFKKDYKRLKKRGTDLSILYEVIDVLQHGKILGEKYRDHALSGKYEGFRECHIKSDWLLIYLIEEDSLILTLTATGTHADLFRK